MLLYVSVFELDPLQILNIKMLPWSKSVDYKKIRYNHMICFKIKIHKGKYPVIIWDFC